MPQAVVIPSNLGKTLKPAGIEANKIDVNLDSNSLVADPTTGAISAKIDPASDNILKSSPTGLKVDIDDLAAAAVFLVKDAFGVDLFVSFPKPV